MSQIRLEPAASWFRVKRLAISPKGTLLRINPGMIFAFTIYLFQTCTVYASKILLLLKWHTILHNINNLKLYFYFKRQVAEEGRDHSVCLGLFKIIISNMYMLLHTIKMASHVLHQQSKTILLLKSQGHKIRRQRGSSCRPPSHSRAPSQHHTWPDISPRHGTFWKGVGGF